MFLEFTKAANCLASGGQALTVTVIKACSQRPEAIFAFINLSLVSLSALYYLVAMKFEVVWKSSHYHSDGRRRSRPKPSVFHGWLVKWRATFSGNEQLRREGIREMREAKAIKRQKKVAKRAKTSRAKPGLFSWFSVGNTKKTRRALRPDGLAQSSHSSHKSSSSSRQAARISRRPPRQTSRQPSYNSKRGVARMRSSKK
ncbi:hypothetical protein BDR06DRAFT_544540 [Suillus hirtellus]|nr:hypothetical protein BDR06DRAFT_544540 [Suillus hirtellus]